MRISVSHKGGITLANLQQLMYMIPGKTDNRTVVNVRRRWYRPRVVEIWVDLEEGEKNEDPAKPVSS